MKVKYVDEWKISDKDKEEVKKQLTIWKKEFFKRAGEHSGNVRIRDIKNDDIFFFTDCRDILSNTDLSCKEMELEDVMFL